MANLDFHWTCGDIDSQIESVNEIVKDSIAEFIAEKSIVDDFMTYVKRDIADCFEVLRRVNSDMREQAELQIGRVEERVEELEAEIEGLKGTIMELEG